MSSEGEIFVSEYVEIELIDKLGTDRKLSVDPDGWAEINDVEDFPDDGEGFVYEITDDEDVLVGLVKWDVKFSVEDGGCGKYITAEPINIFFIPVEMLSKEKIQESEAQNEFKKCRIIFGRIS